MISLVRQGIRIAFDRGTGQVEVSQPQLGQPRSPARVRTRGITIRRSAAQRDAPSVHEVGGYSIRISDEPDDPTWDDFLEKGPGSAYTQASCWGRARASIGWRTIRVVVSEDGQVVAGAQMQTRALRGVVRAGFVFGGPIVDSDRPGLAALVVDEIMATGKAGNLQYLAVQPPADCDRVSEELARRGFRRGVLDVLYIYHPAGAILDLQPDLDVLFANMSKSRRRNIRSAERHGVTVRRGSEADVPIFNRLEDAHSARLGYVRRAESYYTDLWRALAPRGHIEFFIAEYEGEPVCAQLAIPFGRTCYHHERAWSGEHEELYTAELVEWEAIRWARSAGYRFIDFGGIEKPVAEAVLSAKEDPRVAGYGAALFKLRWGGQVIVNPPFLDYVYDPALRLGYRSIPPALLRSAWLERLAKRLKETGP